MALRSDESIVFKPVSVCAWECLGVLCLCVHPWVPVSVCGPVSALVGASVRVCLCLHPWVPVCVREESIFHLLFQSTLFYEIDCRRPQSPLK